MEDDPYADLKMLLEPLQSELDALLESAVVAVVPGRVLGSFVSADQAYEAAVAEVGPTGRFLIRSANGKGRGGDQILIRLTVGVAPAHARSLATLNITPSPPIEIVGCLDTGAQSTILSPTVAAELGLPEVNRVVGESVGGTAFRMPIVMAEIKFPGGLPFTMRVGVASCRAGTGALVGMDIIRHSRIQFDCGEFLMGIARAPF